MFFAHSAVISEAWRILSIITPIMPRIPDHMLFPRPAVFHATVIRSARFPIVLYIPVIIPRIFSHMAVPMPPLNALLKESPMDANRLFTFVRAPKRAFTFSTPAPPFQAFEKAVAMDPITSNIERSSSRPLSSHVNPAPPVKTS